MGRKVFRKRVSRAVALGLAATLCVGSTGISEVWADEQTDEEEESSSGTYTYDAEYVSERIANNYTKVSAGYALPEYAGEDVVCKMSEAAEDTDYLTSDTRDYEGDEEVLDLTTGDTVTLKVEVPESGQYFMLFDYLSYDESILPISMDMQIDGEYPFYECRNLEFETTWLANEEPTYDRYDNEVVTVPDKAIQWEEKYLMDSSYRHASPLAVELEAGEHEITLSIGEGTFLLGNITFASPYEVPAYTGSETASGDDLIELQGEDYTYTNDSSIHGVAEYDTSLDPYEVSDTVLNTIDSDSYDAAGQEITYEFEVEEAGYYYLAMNYRQSDKTDFEVFLNVKMETSNYFINDDSMKTLTFYMNSLVNANNTVSGQGIAAAATLIMFVPNLIFFIIVQNSVMNTMANSGIK